MTVVIKEVCIHCHRNICVGQSVIECFECDSIIHSKCYNFSEVDSTCENYYCNDLMIVTIYLLKGITHLNLTPILMK